MPWEPESYSKQNNGSNSKRPSQSPGGPPDQPPPLKVSCELGVHVVLML